MTTYDFYRVTLPEFIRHVAVERFSLEKQNYEPGAVSLFSILLTEIHYLEMHMTYLRGLRFSGRPDISIDKDVAVQNKLAKKHVKLRRYERWIKQMQ